MPADYKLIQQRIQAFDFKGLFTQELMWNHLQTRDLQIPVEGVTYILSPVAERGMAVYVCVILADAVFPSYLIRRKIDTQVTRISREHLIIFCDATKTRQIWQWVKREGSHSSGRQFSYYKGQTGDALVQRIQRIAFDFEDEPNVATTVARVDAALGSDKVTKQFYEQFKQEHDNLLSFLEGIPDEFSRRWYTSVILNRLMFIYFIQQKGFLENDHDYLATKLAESMRRREDAFFSEFLLPLFFDGFATPEQERNPHITQLLGRVPYLNGGLFLKHEIELAAEKRSEPINIKDALFERIFLFFNKWHWHLDDRLAAKDDEINPDVLGYVFEKYINQREMGAYYTKPDITEYIARNTILPVLLHRIRALCADAFDGDHSIWHLLRDDPDRYIHPALKHGMELEIPTAIMEGIDNPKKRGLWNKIADSGFGLNTETWREVIGRHTYYRDVRERLTSGLVLTPDDLVTLSLDGRRLLQDAIYDQSFGQEFVWNTFSALRSLSILDPTCGSGAFLFAALGVLEPIYEACIDRMEELLLDLDNSRSKHHPQKLRHFRNVVESIEEHPNREYFILKTIILRNLFGVDIMEEAAEICKLRLFLKLVAQLEPGEKVEPLPDIDFNIRAGNSLIGFINKEHLDKSLTRIGHQEKGADIYERADQARREFDRFRNEQIVGGTVSHEELVRSKQELRIKLAALQTELDDYLAGEYNVESSAPQALQHWRKRYQPFHWYSQFFGTMTEGGFDIIIGNPPYVEYTKKDKVTRHSVRDQYQIKGYCTEACDDLYAFTLERSTQLLSRHGALGMIVPVSIVSTDGFKPLRKLLLNDEGITWTLNFAERPSKLFTGVEKRLTIWISKREKGRNVQMVSAYRRWFSEERNPLEPEKDVLFSKVRFVQLEPECLLVADSIPKIGSALEIEILKKLQAKNTIGTSLLKSSKNKIYYTRKLRYFVQFFDFIPKIWDSTEKLVLPTELKSIDARSQAEKDTLLCCLNSSLFFWFFTAFSDVRNINRREIDWFRFNLNEISTVLTRKLNALSKEVMNDFQRNSRIIANDYKARGRLKIQSFQPRLSKPVLDRIDTALCSHYEFTPDELDFILNFDYKYRLGQDEEIDDK